MYGALRQLSKRLRETIAFRIRRASYSIVRFALTAETRRAPQASREE